MIRLPGGISAFIQNETTNRNFSAIFKNYKFRLPNSLQNEFKKLWKIFACYYCNTLALVLFTYVSKSAIFFGFVMQSYISIFCVPLILEGSFPRHNKMLPIAGSKSRGGSHVHQSSPVVTNYITRACFSRPRWEHLAAANSPSK